MINHESLSASSSSITTNDNDGSGMNEQSAGGSGRQYGVQYKPSTLAAATGGKSAGCGLLMSTHARLHARMHTSHRSRELLPPSALLSSGVCARVSACRHDERPSPIAARRPISGARRLPARRGPGGRGASFFVRRGQFPHPAHPHPHRHADMQACRRADMQTSRHAAIRLTGAVQCRGCYIPPPDGL